VPQRREETKSVVRESSRPVRVLVDQQASVIRRLAESSRAVDDLDNELRRLRAATGSREARYAALAAAVRDEMRLYEAEVAAAADRLGQQRLPGGGARFAREQFVAQVCHHRQFIRQYIHSSKLKSDVCCRLQVAPSGERYGGNRRPGRKQRQPTAGYMA